MSDKEALWRERIAAWKASGQSLRSFALQSGWRPRQMGYWKQRLEKEKPAAAACLIPVEIKHAVAVPVPVPITLRSPGGWSVELAGDAPAAWLAELLRGL